MNQPTEAQDYYIGYLARRYLEEKACTAIRREAYGFVQGIRSVHGECRAVRMLEAAWLAATDAPLSAVTLPGEAA